MLRRICTVLVLAGAVQFAYADVITGPSTCTVVSPPISTVAASGESELVSDVLFTCVTTTGGSASNLVNIELFLNTDFTSRIMNPVTKETEALLLIDEPLPGVLNISNGFPYLGQVKGTLGIPAGSPGSGNAYQGTQAVLSGVTQDNTMIWQGVPLVDGTHTYRITNIRANAVLLGPPGASVMTNLGITSDIAVTINNATVTVGLTQTPMVFSTAPTAAAPGLDIKFQEGFPSAFKKRIENTGGGPLTSIRQDLPGTNYCTESGFVPQFAPLNPGAIGFANTGTRLVAHFANLPPPVFVLIVPNEVTSSGGDLVAHRVIPPLAPNLTGGIVLTFSGLSLEGVTAAHTADVVYEVTAAAPYAGKNGCLTLDSFNIEVRPFFPVSLAPATVTGALAPLDPTTKASATAPEPRFLP